MKQPLAALMIILATNVMAQRDELISGNFKDIPLSQFIATIERQTDYQFFFKKNWVDSVLVNMEVDNKSVPEILASIFENTDLHYAIDQDKSVYITKGRQIYGDLPVDFFNENRNTTSQSASFDYSDYERKEKQRKQAEEKLFHIGNKSANAQGSATLAGNVRDIATGEPVVGAAVFIENPTIGVATDQFGYYALTIPKGRHEVKVKSIGMKSTLRHLMLYSDGKLDIELEEDITPLKEVVIESDQGIRVSGIQMGMERLDIKTMKQIPLALGETDILKVVLALPGVQSVGEGTVGLNVRGGATNQNLILFNDAVIYNPSHLFGFFSTFNPDVLKNVELYKSGITADYGGRLSSVLDVRSREGNQSKLSGSGGVSPITGRLTLEGPIVKNRTSFVIGGRSTYSDWILRKVKSREFNNSNASFYDLTASVTHKINDDNNVYVSAYLSKDHFKLNSDTTYSYSDRNTSLKWKHVFNNKLYGVLTGGFSNYTYSVASDINPVNAFSMGFNISQMNVKADFSYFPSSKHVINAGLSTIRYHLMPGSIEPRGNESIVSSDELQNEQGLESALYISENFEVTPRLALYFGFRYSLYQYLGARETYSYIENESKEVSNITDTLYYGKGKSISIYDGLEPRFSVRYILPGNASVKLSYNRMFQYIQMLSNTTAINPTDIWKLSDPHVRPQRGDQISIGYYKNLKGNSLETSVEAYYKTIHNAIDFKSGASLLLNHYIETDVLPAAGKAYGAEFLIKKSAGKINGWMSYTYSRSFLRSTGTLPREIVNGGRYYPSNHDKPHAINFIGNYKFNRRFNLSMNIIYSTGRPITLPLLRYDLDGVNRVYYSDRNQFRIPDYFRSDISINIEGNHKIKKLAHSSWTFAVYNLTGRANAYSIFFVTEGSQIKGYKLSIFARPIPTITYNFKF